MKKIIVFDKLAGWEFGIYKAFKTSNGYALYKMGAFIRWFPALKDARMYAIKDDYKDR